jgi:hypothetical protein
MNLGRRAESITAERESAPEAGHVWDSISPSTGMFLDRRVSPCERKREDLA